LLWGEQSTTYTLTWLPSRLSDLWLEPRENRESDFMKNPSPIGWLAKILGVILLANLALNQSGGGWSNPLAGTAFSAEATPETSPDAPASDRSAAPFGISRGLCVVLGDAQGELALRLAKQTELLIYTQWPKPEDAEKFRRLVDAQGLYGTRIYVEQGAFSRLHLADNLADLVLATGDAAAMPETESLRVLRPQGKARLGSRELTKPFPNGIDDWSHPYHGPDNNPASKDQVAQGPYLTQFLADPRYAPLPQVAVASAGRVFKAFGHIAFKAREEPWLNTLAAFNGYNGTLLWRRELPASIMVHRNTLIATPTVLYYGDDKSCKIIDAASGSLQAEIVPPAEVAAGTFWKWMALEKGILYALVGEQEQRDPVIKARMQSHGWPWNPLSPGFNQPENPWGYGRTLLAVDPQTKAVLWHYQESEPIDSRALCMKNGHLYAFRFGTYLTCLDAQTGQIIWRKTPANAPALFASLGSYQDRQDWRTNWRTTAYLKCSDQALYFSGPPVGKLLAVAADDGRILWQHPYDNYQLVLQDDALYGISGQIDSEVSRKFDPLTGRVLAEIKLGRRACTRPTGASDAIFFRADEGSTRLDLASGAPQLVSPMRAQCQDGVTIANGLLYWWPSVCDCNLTLYGITSLSPAGKFDYSQAAIENERLERQSDLAPNTDSFPISSADWPTFRANNLGTVTSDAAVPANSVRRLWEISLPREVTPTAPTAVGEFVFLAGSDGIVRALRARTGEPAWKAYTGGAIRFPPTLWNGRAYVGSGDGWVYAFDARGPLAGSSDSKASLPLWRFRAAPVERRIPVYGQLLSTWPAASGVLVEEGIAYVAAGIVNYDGTHVYALDALTGRIKWQNNTSGHLDPVAHSGVSVQGHLMLYDKKLWLPGGNAVSPACYDVSNGRCLNDSNLVHLVHNNNVLAAISPRGWELYQVGNRVMVSGKPFYSHPQYPVFDPSVLNKMFVASAGSGDLAWINNSKLVCYARPTTSRNERLRAGWGKKEIPGLQSLWERQSQGSVALAICSNAVIVANASEVTALNVVNGQTLWTQPLPSAPVPWGLAITRDGYVILTLENGAVQCFGKALTLAEAK
jgi:outer membrane protein assembly factor BamB